MKFNFFWGHLPFSALLNEKAISNILILKYYNCCIIKRDFLAKNKILILLQSFLLFACTAQKTEEHSPYPFQMPMLNNFAVDQDFSEWQSVPKVWLTADEKNRIAPETFVGYFKLAWQPKGLAFYAQVKDDFLKEEEAPILQNDGLELFISKEQGSQQMIQYIISLGISEAFPKARIEKVDYGAGQSFTGVTDMQLLAESSEKGYQLEGFIPFASLGFTPKQGDTLALNFYINDADQEGRAVRHSWHYFPSTYNNRNAQYLLVMSKKPQMPQLTTKVFLDDTTVYRFSVLGDASLAGKNVALVSGSESFAEAALQTSGTYAIANFSISKTDIPTDTVWTLQLGDNFDQSIDPTLVPLRYIDLPKPHRFEQAIQIFEAKDRKNPPPKNAVLFIGSSSIRMWPQLAQDFPEHQVIQRGFGGSRTEDVLYFYHRIVTPYQPKTIVYFEGVNDINIGRSPDSVVANTERFLQQVARDLPETKVIILSTTISVKKRDLKEKYLATNTLLEKMVQQYPKAQYLDLVPDMLDKNGLPRKEIFSKDSTHMNPTGYQIWAEKVRPFISSP